MKLLRLLAPLALLALPAAAQETAEEERDRGFLTGLIEDNLSSTARQVVVEGFEGALSSRASVESLTIADAEGVWLRATDLVLDWNRSALFGGRIEIEELSAGTIAVLRAPVADPAAPSPEATPFALPELPVSVEIGRLDAARIELGEDLLGEALALTLSGAVSLSGGEGAANVAAEIVEGSTGSLSLDGSYSNETQVLELDLDLQEAAEGLLARALDLPGLPAVELNLEGTGPIEDYEATLALATDGAPRIEGSFSLVSARPEGSDLPPSRGFRLDVAGDVTPLVAPELRDFFGPDVRLAVEGVRRSDGAVALSTLDVGAQALDLSGEALVSAEGWPERLRLSGTVGVEDGAPVTLPGAGGATVGRVVLDLAYDQAEGDAWTGTFAVTDLATGGARVPSLTLSGGGTIVPATDAAPGAFTGALDYAATGLAFDDPALAQAVGADVSGEVELSRADDGGPLRISTLTLRGPGVEASAEGTVAGAEAGFRVDSAVVLSAESLDRFAALTGLDLAGAAELTLDSSVRPLDGIFDLDLAGSTQDLALGIAELDPLLGGAGTVTLRGGRDEAGTRVDTLEIATDAVRISADADLTSAQSRAAFDLAVTDLGLSFPTLAGPARVVGTATRDSVGQVVLDATATAPGATLRANASQAAPTEEADAPGAIAVALTAEVDDLGAYQPVLDRFASSLPVAPAGAATLTVGGAVRGTADDPAAAFDLAVTAATTDLRLGVARLDPLLGGAGALDARVVRTGPAAFRVEGLDLATDRATLALDAALADGTASGRVDLRVADVAGVLPGLAGPASLVGDVARAGDGGLDVDLRATLPQGSASIDGTVAPPDEGYAFDGTASADLPDIAFLSPFVGRALGGALAATATGSARPDLSALDLDVSARSRDLRLGLPQVEPLLAGAGTWSGRVERSPEGGLAGDVTIDTPLLDASAAGTFAAGGGSGRFDVTVADVAPLAPGLSGPATATGTAARATDGTIDVQADLSAPGTTARIDASVAPPAGGYEVTGTVAAAVADLGPLSRLTGRALGGGLDATVTGSVRPDLSRFDLSVEAVTRDLDPGNAAAARVLAGAGSVTGRVLRGDGGGLVMQDLAARFPNLQVNADATGEGAGGTATFDARLADIGLFTPDFAGPVTAAGTATLSDGGLSDVAVDVTGPGGIGARVTGGIAGAQADLAAAGTAPLALVNGFIEPRSLDGTADFDLRLAGPLTLSSLSGTVRVAGARLGDPRLGDALAGIDGTATLAGGTAMLDLAGALLNGGSLSLRGPVGLAAPFPADLSVTGANLVLRDPTLYEAQASGTVTVTGPLAGGAQVAGAIDVTSAEIRVPSSGIGPLGDVPPVRHVAPSAPVRETLARAGLTGEGTAAAGAGGGGPAYGLDLVVRAPARVFVRGRGLDAELGGQLRLGGDTGAVVPAGQFDLLRGRLDILGQRFTLTEGSATLQGDFVPFLRLVAETQARTGTTVAIVLEGPATEPSVTFSSSPELPQDEVLAQLIFGVDLASITPLQAVQLASAVATLAGRGGGLLDDIRGDAGLADLDLTTDEAGNAALRLGRYIGENVYTDVLVGSEETEATINLDLTPDLTVRAGVSSEGETSLGIEFARDY